MSLIVAAKAKGRTLMFVAGAAQEAREIEVTRLEDTCPTAYAAARLTRFFLDS
jgi:hypothetical protein